jgi:hypothetical protein
MSDAEVALSFLRADRQAQLRAVFPPGESARLLIEPIHLVVRPYEGYALCSDRAIYLTAIAEEQRERLWVRVSLPEEVQSCRVVGKPSGHWFRVGGTQDDEVDVSHMDGSVTRQTRKSLAAPRDPFEFLVPDNQVGAMDGYLSRANVRSKRYPFTKFWSDYAGPDPSVEARLVDARWRDVRPGDMFLTSFSGTDGEWDELIRVEEVVERGETVEVVYNVGHEERDTMPKRGPVTLVVPPDGLGASDLPALFAKDDR